MIRLASLDAGDTVLDIGCGTGTLAIAAKKRMGSAGAVFGIDASPAMVAKATRKSARAGIDVAFTNAFVEALPFPDARFEVALSTMVLHHLPRQVRRRCTAEIRRVLNRAADCSWSTSDGHRPGADSSRISIATVMSTSLTSRRC